MLVYVYVTEIEMIYFLLFLSQLETDTQSQPSLITRNYNHHQDWIIKNPHTNTLLYDLDAN